MQFIIFVLKTCEPKKYTLYLVCVCRALYLACVWVCTLWERRIYIFIYLAIYMQIQMAYRSVVYFSTGTIGTNGANRQVVYAWLSFVNMCSLQMVHQSTNDFSIGINLYQWYQQHQSTRLHWQMVISLPMVRLVRVFWRLVSVCVHWTCVFSGSVTTAFVFDCTVAHAR